MCWSSIKPVKRQVAKEDIKTFKVGYTKNAKLYSYYRGFIYDFNQLYETTIQPEWLKGFRVINQGFHSYNFKKCSYKKDKKYGFKGYAVQSKKIGLIDLTLDITYGITSIFECIIPKGAEYFENENGEIVSNQIIISKIIE